jgi:hypothetical protein
VRVTCKGSVGIGAGTSSDTRSLPVPFTNIGTLEKDSLYWRKSQ